MANNAIINYLKEGLKKGYSLNSLKDALLKQGYPSSKVNELAESLEKSKKRFPIRNYIFVFLAFLFVVVGIYFCIQIFKEKEVIVPKGLSSFDQKLWEEMLTYTDYSLDGYYTQVAKRFAINQSNPLVCSLLRTINLQEDCLFFLAQTSSNFSLCEKISNISKERVCLGTFGDILSCDDFYSDNPEERVNCYVYIGYNTNNSSVCEKFEGLDKDDCYAEMALHENDIALCDKVSEDLMFCCKALIKNDISYAEQITNQNFKKMCFAMLKNDTSICEGVEKENYLINKDSCCEAVVSRHIESRGF